MTKEHIRCPQLVLDRAKSIIAERRENDDSRTIYKSLDSVKKKISNLLTLAEDTTDKDELTELARRSSVAPMAFVHLRGYREKPAQAHEYQVSVSRSEW